MGIIEIPVQYPVTSTDVTNFQIEVETSAGDYARADQGIDFTGPGIFNGGLSVIPAGPFKSPATNDFSLGIVQGACVVEQTQAWEPGGLLFAPNPLITQSNNVDNLPLPALIYMPYGPGDPIPSGNLTGGIGQPNLAGWTNYGMGFSKDGTAVTDSLTAGTCRLVFIVARYGSRADQPTGTYQPPEPTQINGVPIQGQPCLPASNPVIAFEAWLGGVFSQSANPALAQDNAIDPTYCPIAAINASGGCLIGCFLVNYGDLGYSPAQCFHPVAALPAIDAFGNPVVVPAPFPQGLAVGSPYSLCLRPFIPSRNNPGWLSVSGIFPNMGGFAIPNTVSGASLMNPLMFSNQNANAMSVFRTAAGCYTAFLNPAAYGVASLPSINFLGLPDWQVNWSNKNYDGAGLGAGVQWVELTDQTATACSFVFHRIDYDSPSFELFDPYFFSVKVSGAVMG